MLATVQERHATLAPRLAQELREIERLLESSLGSDLRCVSRLVEHVERYRGKMLRPTLLLAAALASGEPGHDLREAHRTLAAVVELIHLATLVHDDVLDDAVVRRQGATVNKLAGNETAVMLGDFLFSRAYLLLSRLDDPATHRVLAQATGTICEGELLQLANRNNRDLDEATYRSIIERKTATLCAVSCRLGAMTSAAPAGLTQTLHDYGLKLGSAFQIVDDLLDITGDAAVVGKTLGRDIQKGKLTLPLIHFRHAAGNGRHNALGALLDRAAAGDPRRQPDPELMARIAAALRASGSLDYAADAARRLVDAACESLLALPESAARDLLRDLAQAVLTRRL